MRKYAIVGALAILASLLMVVPALASHPEVTLPGSDFEIDTDANLVVDDTGNDDWMSVTEIRQQDEPTGQQDDSLGNGTKEDTEVPSVIDGSIPNNKSDLRFFGAYLEDTGSGKFLNLYWTRVQAPTGTTNMDFEFNKSTELSSNGVTPVRTEGDILIQYDLASGGTDVELFLSRWVEEGPKSLCEAANSTPCWGVRDDLTSDAEGTGSINSSAIPEGSDDGLGEGDGLDPRTFGEAQIDFDAFSGSDPCVGFASAYLKSRSSDSFTAALKDFIAPVDLNFNNCGAIEVTKTRKHEAAEGTGPVAHAGVTFTVTDPSTTPPTVIDTGVTGTDGKVCFGNLPLGTYNVTETLPTGYSADQALTQSVVVDSVGSCSSGPETVSFANTPLTNITVSVDSVVPGGTASTIECTDPAETDGTKNGTTGAGGDGSLTVNNLEPSTVTCTIIIDP